MRSFFMIFITSMMLSGAAYAQPEGMTPPRTGDQQQQQDRDRFRDMHKEMHKEMDQERTRERIHKMDNISGSQLLTEEERQRFRDQMQQASGDEERQRIAAEHREMIQQRAEERGVDLSGDPMFGRQMMTREERMQYHEQMMNATSDEDRERIREEHREKMLQRARERNVNLNDENGE